jgi:hypothetical protein
MDGGTQTENGPVDVTIIHQEHNTWGIGNVTSKGE